mgnify:CR=1 FL=1
MSKIDLTLFESADELARNLECEGDKVRLVEMADQATYEAVGFEFVGFVDGKIMMRLDKELRKQKREYLSRGKDKAMEMHEGWPKVSSGWAKAIGSGMFEDATADEMRAGNLIARHVCRQRGFGDGRLPRTVWL